MDEWVMESTDAYQRRYKYYKKKHPYELLAVADNLDTYFKTLGRLNNPLRVNDGFIHNEGEGIIAIDQKGGHQKVKLQQTRLYVYADISTKTLFLLTIGNKQTQKDDIRLCQKYVRKEIRNGSD